MSRENPPREYTARDNIYNVTSPPRQYNTRDNVYGNIYSGTSAVRGSSATTREPLSRESSTSDNRQSGDYESISNI